MQGLNLESRCPQLTPQRGGSGVRTILGTFTQCCGFVHFEGSGAVIFIPLEPRAVLILWSSSATTVSARQLGEPGPWTSLRTDSRLTVTPPSIPFFGDSTVENLSARLTGPFDLAAYRAVIGLAVACSLPWAGVTAVLGDLRVSTVPTQPVLSPRSHSSQMLHAVPCCKAGPQRSKHSPCHRHLQLHLRKGCFSPRLGTTAQENIKQKQTRLLAFSCPSQGSSGASAGIGGTSC